MAEPSPTAVGVGATAVAVVVERVAALPGALGALGLASPRPVIVVVGGAGAVTAAELDRLRPLFDEAILPVAARAGATIVDGGTRSGVMRALGESRARAGTNVLMVGVASLGTVRLPFGPPPGPDAGELEPNHDRFVLVPGDTWGDESPWLTHVAKALAGPRASVTVLINGGEIAVRDVRHSVAADRPVLVVEGSGRAADDLAAAVDEGSDDPATRRLTGSGLLVVVPADDPQPLARALQAALSVPDARRCS